MAKKTQVSSVSPGSAEKRGVDETITVIIVSASLAHLSIDNWIGMPEKGTVGSTMLLKLSTGGMACPMRQALLSILSARSSAACDVSH